MCACVCVCARARVCVCVCVCADVRTYGTNTRRSKVFLGMFMTDMEESRTGVVKIKDVTELSFRAFLQYIYTGSCAGLRGDARQLWALADIFQVAPPVLAPRTQVNQNSCIHSHAHTHKVQE